MENRVASVLDTAFGVNKTPTWEDFLNFLADRCIPKTRCGLDYYLKEVGVSEYDPVQLVEKTQGRMAEDHKCWNRLIYLPYYPPQFRYLLKERVLTVLLEQKKNCSGKRIQDRIYPPYNKTEIDILFMEKSISVFLLGHFIMAV